MKPLLYLFKQLAILLLFINIVVSKKANCQVISHIGGGFNGDNVQALGFPIGDPRSIVLDSSGNILIANQYQIRRVDKNTGILKIVAGNINKPYNPNETGLSALESGFQLIAMCKDVFGNIYIQESKRIRKIDAVTGIVSTLIGSAPEGFSGDGGPAHAASINTPEALATDKEGNLYFSDKFNYRIRKINAATGIITTIAGSGISGLSGDGGLALNCRIRTITSITVDTSGNVYLFQNADAVIRKISKNTGIIQRFAGMGYHGSPVEAVSATASPLGEVKGMHADSLGNIFITDKSNRVIRRITLSTGIINTIAGDGLFNFDLEGPALQTSILPEATPLFDDQGNMFFCETNRYYVRRMDAISGNLTLYAGNGISYFYGDNGPAVSAVIGQANGIVIDSSENIYISDFGTARIRKITKATGIISTIAGNGTSVSEGNNIPAVNASVRTAGIAMDKDQHIYLSEVNTGWIRKIDANTGIIQTIAGMGTGPGNGDNGPAMNAIFYNPESLVFDSSNNIFIADSYNHRIRKITASTGIVTTIAGLGGSGATTGDGGPATSAYIAYPRSVSLDKYNNIYFTNNANRIRKIDGTSGIINNYAGNGSNNYMDDSIPAVAGALSLNGITVNKTGDIFIADGFYRIRKVNVTDQYLQTIAGTGTFGYSADTILAKNAILHQSTCINTDRYGDLYFANNGISKITFPDFTVKAGNWSDPSIWNKGKVPDAFTQTSILHPVTVDINTAVFSINLNGTNILTVNPGVNLDIVGP